MSYSCHSKHQTQSRSTSQSPPRRIFQTVTPKKSLHKPRPSFYSKPVTLYTCASHTHPIFRPSTNLHDSIICSSDLPPDFFPPSPNISYPPDNTNQDRRRLSRRLLLPPQHHPHRIRVLLEALDKEGCLTCGSRLSVRGEGVGSVGKKPVVVAPKRKKKRRAGGSGVGTPRPGTPAL